MATCVLNWILCVASQISIISILLRFKILSFLGCTCGSNSRRRTPYLLRPIVHRVFAWRSRRFRGKSCSQEEQSRPKKLTTTNEWVAHTVPEMVSPFFDESMIFFMRCRLPVFLAVETYTKPYSTFRRNDIPHSPFDLGLK